MSKTHTITEKQARHLIKILKPFSDECDNIEFSELQNHIDELCKRVTSNRIKPIKYVVVRGTPLASKLYEDDNKGE